MRRSDIDSADFCTRSGRVSSRGLRRVLRDKRECCLWQRLIYGRWCGKVYQAQLTVEP